VSPGRVTVVGLGPAGPDLVTAAATDALASVPPAQRFVRTLRHPAASLPELAGATAFDAVYEAAVSLDEVYATIVARLVAAAGDGDVVYAVPGSPAVAERTVELLRADAAVDTVVVPALSFLDLAWARLGIDPFATGVRIVDGHRFAVEAAGERGPLLVGQCDSPAVLSEIKLAFEDDPPPTVVVLQRLGLPDEALVELAWEDLDRAAAVVPDHLTSLWVPALAAPVAGEVAAFVELVRTLRAECPWDREQTHVTLTRHLLEETYEVLEAIEALDVETGEGYEHLEEELGDLLFQVVFHATIGAEEGAFTMADVARGIHDKLVRRHPHVFAGVEIDGRDDVITNWEQIKKAEKGHAGLMEGISGSLPSLLYAHKVQRKAASVGLDPVTDPGVAPDAIGDALFALVAAARRADVDPEAVMRATAAEFRDRFAAMERAAEAEGVDLAKAGADTVARLWTEANPRS
jgi:tetrapyrrole methylase family protein/MazG family protein